METFKSVVDHIRSQVNIEDPVKNKFHIIVVPRYLCTYEDELEQLGLLNTVITLHSFQWMPLYLDTGLLSLEFENVFSDLFVYQNAKNLPTLAKTLWQMCFVVGKPKFILALGPSSNVIVEHYDQFCEDKGNCDKPDSDFGALIIIDRNIDYPAALLSPGTYSALLSEVYNVRTGVCDNKQDISEDVDEKYNPTIKKQPVHFNLDSVQDNVYGDIKNRYFTEVTAVLSNLTKQLKSEKVQSKEMALDEIKHYVQTQLQATKNRKKCITNHLLAAESIINVLGHRYENQKSIEQNIMKNSDKALSVSFLDQILATENNAYLSLRLFCLLSVTQGLSDSEIRIFWRKFLHQFGFKYGFALNNLVTAGFIPETAVTSNNSAIQAKIKIPIFTSTNFYMAAKNLRQIPTDPEKVNLKFPTCASYVYGGSYIPLITQIAGLLLNSTPLEDVKNKLEPLGQLLIRNVNGYPLQNRVLLIYLIGGVTYAEIAACNLLETLTGAQICMLSDRVINGNDLMKSVLDYPN